MGLASATRRMFVGAATLFLSGIVSPHARAQDTVLRLAMAARAPAPSPEAEDLPLIASAEADVLLKFR